MLKLDLSLNKGYALLFIGFSHVDVVAKQVVELLLQLLVRMHRILRGLERQWQSAAAPMDHTQDVVEGA